MAILVMLNNFFHDFSAAGWLFATVLIWGLLRKDYGDGQGENILADIFAMLLVLTRVSIVGIIVFGLVRAFAYNKYEWNPHAGQGQVTLLAVKHIIFTVIFVVGMIYYIKASRFVKRVRNEKSQ